MFTLIVLGCRVTLQAIKLRYHRQVFMLGVDVEGCMHSFMLGENMPGFMMGENMHGFMLGENMQGMLGKIMQGFILSKVTVHTIISGTPVRRTMMAFEFRF